MKTTEARRLIWNGLLDLVYPPVCLVCGAEREAGIWCDTCRDDVKPILPPFCDRCGIPVEAERLVCRRCETEAPPYSWSQAAGQYSGQLAKAIQRYKYNGKLALAEPLGILLARSLDAPPSPLLVLPSGERLEFDAVVPVPLHPAKIRQRGFNQSERLARVVCRERGWQIDTKGLVRTRNTKQQATLKGQERTSNVAGAFAVRSPLHFQHQSVLVVDDVLTTMATVSECARAVREAGAKRVCIVALARGTT